MIATASLDRAVEAIYNRVRRHRPLTMEELTLPGALLRSRVALSDAMAILAMSYARLTDIDRLLTPERLWALRSGIRNPQCYLGRKPAKVGAFKEWMSDDRFFEVARVSEYRYHCRMGMLDRRGRLDPRSFRKDWFMGWHRVQKAAEEWFSQPAQDVLSVDLPNGENDSDVRRPAPDWSEHGC